MKDTLKYLSETFMKESLKYILEIFQQKFSRIYFQKLMMKFLDGLLKVSLDKFPVEFFKNLLKISPKKSGKIALANHSWISSKTPPDFFRKKISGIPYKLFQNMIQGFICKFLFGIPSGIV